MSKFKLTPESKINFLGKTLFRIELVADCEIGSKGYKGGWVEKESNIRQAGNAWVSGDAEVCGNAEVCNDAAVYGNAEVYGNADYIQISPLGSQNEILTAFKGKDKKIYCSRGCFYGTISEFSKKVEEKHRNTKYGKEYKAAITMIKARLK